MRQIVLTEIAQKDLFQIAKYTQTTWGKDQRKKYLQVFDQVLISLAENPRIGLTCPTIRPNYYKLPFQKHLIFYTFDKDQLSVARILHGSMDIEQYTV